MDHLLIVIAHLSALTGAPPSHAMAAHAAETDLVPARQLLRQSWRESRWIAARPGQVTVSRMEGSKRRTGVIRGRWRPIVSGPYFCGTLQLKRKTQDSCRAIDADVPGSYREAVAHLMDWRAYCINMGRATVTDWRTCALAGYGGGTKATRMRGRAWRYARAVLREAGLQ